MKWKVAVPYSSPISWNSFRRFNVCSLIISITLMLDLVDFSIAVQALPVSTCSPHFQTTSIDQRSQNEILQPCPVAKPCQCICEPLKKRLWIDCFYRQLKNFPNFLKVSNSSTPIEWNVDLAFNQFEIINNKEENWLPDDIRIRQILLSGSLAYDLILQLQLTHRHLIDHWPSETQFSILDDSQEQDDDQKIDESKRKTSSDQMKILSQLNLDLRNKTSRIRQFHLSLAGEPAPILNVYLDHNALESIPTMALRNATGIYEIYLSFNLIEELPAYAFGFSHRLTRIDLSYNKIYLIHSAAFQRHPDAFAGPFLVDYLDLSHNRLTILEPDIFSYLVNLRLLKLEHNHIYSIFAHAWTGLYRLKFLDLSHNYLENFTQAFYSGYLNELNHLKITANSINQLGACEFLSLKSLTKLNLNGNNITSIDSCAFYGLRRSSTSHLLLNVHLRSNSLETIHPCSFHNFARSTIHLENNPLTCNCSFNYLLYERQSIAYTGQECRGGFDYPIQHHLSSPAVRKSNGTLNKKVLNVSKTCQDAYKYYNDLCSQLDCSSVCAPQEQFIIQVTTIATPSRTHLSVKKNIFIVIVLCILILVETCSYYEL